MMLHALTSLFRFFASFGLSVVLLLLLMLLTFLGTLQQVEEGLYQVQKEYFGSLFLVHRFGGTVPVPLPGAYLLLALAFINITCGAIVRARRGWRHIGVLIAHVGILALLAGGFVTYEYAIRGHLTLYEGEQSDRFQNDEGWELEAAGPAAGGAANALVIPGTQFESLTGTRSRTFFSDQLPFDVTISGYMTNAQLQAAAAGAPLANVVDGAYLKPLPPGREAGENLPGAHLSLKEKAGGAERQYILSARKGPVTAQVGDQTWTLALKRRSWPLPFTLRLDKFTRELHPGTGIAKVFMSDVTKTEDGSTQAVRISMNEPMRHKGFTLYQASWGPSDAGPRDRLFSTLAVVKNPAESMPLISCSIMALGLSIHFAVKLMDHLRQQRRNRS